MYDAAAATAYASPVKVGGQPRAARAGSRSAPNRGGDCGPRPWEVALVVAVTIAIVVITLLAGGGARRTSALTTRAVRISAADTLWSMAQANPVPGQGTAATVEQIRTINGLRTSQLEQGTTLRVPVAEGRALLELR